MRAIVKVAFLDALEAKNITVSDEAVENMLEDVLEKMWQGFDDAIDDLLQSEKDNKFIWIDNLRIALQPLPNEKIEAVIQDKQAKELFQGEFDSEEEAENFCKSWIKKLKAKIQIGDIVAVAYSDRFGKNKEVKIGRIKSFVIPSEYENCPEHLQQYVVEILSGARVSTVTIERSRFKTLNEIKGEGK